MKWTESRRFCSVESTGTNVRTFRSCWSTNLTIVSHDASVKIKGELTIYRSSLPFLDPMRAFGERSAFPCKISCVHPPKNSRKFARIHESQADLQLSRRFARLSVKYKVVTDHWIAQICEKIFKASSSVRVSLICEGLSTSQISLLSQSLKFAKSIERSISTVTQLKNLQRRHQTTM